MMDAPCAVCGIMTHDYGNEYHNLCQKDADGFLTIARGRDMTGATSDSGNAWIKYPDNDHIIVKLILQRGINIATTEANCKQCGKKNDLGSTKCWWCETPQPVSST